MYLECPMSSSYLPVMKAKDFEDLTDKIIGTYIPNTLKSPCPTDIRALAEDCIIVEIKEARLTASGYILGFVVFEEQRFPLPDNGILELETGTIVLDKELIPGSAKYNFTLAHELAHWLLHRAYFSETKIDYAFKKNTNSYVANLTENSQLSRYKPKIAVYDDEWAEYQADCLATSLLMPGQTFVPTAEAILRKYGFCNHQIVSGENIQRGKQVVKELSRIFNVTERGVRIRMRTFDMYVGDCHNAYIN